MFTSAKLRVCMYVQARSSYIQSLVNAFYQITAKTMRRATSNLVELFRGHASSGEYVMVLDACGKMSMDVIAATSLGIDVGSFCKGGDDAEQAKRGEFLKHVKDAFTIDIYKDPWILLRFISG